MAGVRAVILLAALIAASVLGATGIARAAPVQAEMVMDMRTGEVLHARNADTKLHPASLTKMMTLYLVFEAIERGKLRIDQRVRVSAAAAGQPAIKMGFRAGSSVILRDLIRAAAVRSANDSAVVLAEAVAGSEAAFARLMTERARDLGMSRSTFRNASGLTAPGHLSTARDMTLLARRLYFDFPQYFNLFGRQSTVAFGRTIHNTNRLLASYRGADGFKTGYTRAAGYNLVASAERGGERVIATMFGGRSGAQRNARVAALLDLGFQRAPSRARVIPPAELVAKAESPAVPAQGARLAATAAPAPAPRPGALSRPDAAGDVEAAIAQLSAEESGSPSLFVSQIARALGPSAAQASETAPVAAATLALVNPTRRAPSRAPIPTPRGGDLRFAGSPGVGAPDEAAGAAPGDWAVQLGAYAEREIAVARLAAAAFGAMPQLAEAGREIHIAGIDGAEIYRARLTGLDRETARRACEMLTYEGRDCVPIPPSAQ